MNRSMALAIPSALLISTLSAAQTLEVDWLYLSANASWLERSESLIHEQTNLRLPVDQLTLDQFWWQSETPDTQLSWAQPDALGLPTEGATVEIIGEPGLWLIQEANSNHLVLQQGKNVRYWPHSQWHLLNWTSSSDYGMSLTVHQPSQAKGNLFYAWQTPELTAQVRYRLDESSAPAMLYQELIVSNLSDSSYHAPGYSYAQVAHQPMLAMRTMAVSESAMSISAPNASQSQGVPTLVANSPVTLKAGSHIWLPVSKTPLSKVERQYQIQWDTRSTGQLNAQSQIMLSAQSALPDIAGEIKIGVFDQQVALLESYYQPKTSTEAELDLGQSRLVSLNSQLSEPGVWQLTLVNRAEHNARVQLTLNHWYDQKNQRIPLTLVLNANEQKVIQVKQNSAGAIAVSE